MKLPERLTAWLERRAVALMARRPPDFNIGPSNDIYMHRWYLLRTRLGGVYLHLFRRDDDDRALHDHPWSSVSITLWGPVGEIYAPRGTNPSITADHRFRKFYRGDIAFRRGKTAHRVILSGRPWAMTLFFFGPKLRKWGFWCPQGWRHWKEFTAPGNTSQVGRGCE